MCSDGVMVDFDDNNIDDDDDATFLRGIVVVDVVSIVDRLELDNDDDP